MVDRIGAAARPVSIPERPQQPGPVQVLRGPLDPVSRYPVGPLPSAPAATGALADPPDTVPASAALQALADAALEGADVGASSAMRPNQVFLSRQLNWHPPDAALMAASWQVMVRTYGQQRAAWLEQAKGQHVPSSLFMADHNPSAVREGRPGLPLVTDVEPWRFAVLARGAERLVLKVVARESDDEPPRRRRPKVALRLELMLPALGRVVIQLEPGSSSGVLMEVGAAHTSAMQFMREALPQLASLVNRYGLTVIRCRLRRTIPAEGRELDPTPVHTALLTAPHFKAMADIAVLLSSAPVSAAGADPSFGQF
ncbi:hypothetical protein ASF61_07855 [Duganella sp. Leaf126]|uniref:hypothetical protein n=1 Tax=Duganella sp. Leaf126 TaxID=1736266 RepID=UPI0006F61EFB|nr:hypothetical protein [Duganella sp. Leaf126]KQQ36104.1 hypothetical protein ASF61_07855 [Duganella sp. Leaf126]